MVLSTPAVAEPVNLLRNSSLKVGVRGPWTGNPGQKIAGVAFLAPKTAAYKATGMATSKPWEGTAKVFRLGIFKKDTQRAVLLKTIEMPRDGTAVPFAVEAELTAGHELVLMPLMPDWHNATTITIENLVVEEQ